MATKLQFGLEMAETEYSVVMVDLTKVPPDAIRPVPRKFRCFNDAHNQADTFNREARTNPAGFVAVVVGKPEKKARAVEQPQPSTVRKNKARTLRIKSA